MFHEIGNVSCFTNLDTLIMKDNLITFVSNATFKGMSKLRIVDLSYNIIKHIDLNVASNTVCSTLTLNQITCANWIFQIY